MCTAAGNSHRDGTLSAHTRERRRKPQFGGDDRPSPGVSAAGETEKKKYRRKNESSSPPADRGGGKTKKKKKYENTKRFCLLKRICV